MGQTITKWALIAIAATLVVYDIVVAATPEPGDTISEVVRGWGSRLWVLPYYMSVILGHFFINRESSLSSLVRYLALGILGVLTLVLNLTILHNVPWYITIPGGLATGAMLWPQKPKTK